MDNEYNLLILGGGYSTVDVVNSARNLHLDKKIRIYVASNSEEGDAMQLADEKVLIDTADFSSLLKFVQDKHIDGVMTGASEFHLLNMIRFCKICHLNVYATEEQWNICQNKQSFKKLCRKYNVPIVPEFLVENDPQTYEYPIIVKPVDGCSARGISVCESPESFTQAKLKALEYSTSKEIIIEKFMENGGNTMSVKYIIINGEVYLDAIGDRYVLDSSHGKSLITAASFYPSKYTDLYIQKVDKYVKNMFKGLGIKNGVLFMEAIANSTGVFFYEMGLRISGGMTYKITEITNGVNELKMLIHYALTGRMCEDSEIQKINPYLNNHVTATLTVPLRIGRIAQISGLDKIRALPEVYSITQYYQEGDVIKSSYIGTLDQLFARLTIITDSKKQLAEIIQYIISTLSILDECSKEMFITSKLQMIYNDYMN